MKLDLHTHCFEAMHISAPNMVSVSNVGKIVTAVKSKGLDGIAITEHYNNNFGFEAQRIVAEYFSNQILIIPGHEISSNGYHIVELFLPNDKVFRFLPHPIYDDKLKLYFDFNEIQGIEIKNEQYGQYIDKPKIKALAEKYNLLLLSNSDAHNLKNIGYYYNEIDLHELINRSQIFIEYASYNF